MKGIYKITNPAGSIYIGQSIDIHRRITNHKNPNYNNNCFLLSRSYKKYGIKNHSFEVLHELPLDSSAEVLNNYETFCIQQYKEAGVRLLNVKLTSNNHSEETRKKISESHKGKPKSKEHIENQRRTMKGKPSPMDGKTHTNEARKKIKAARAKQTNVKGPDWNKDGFREKMSMKLKGRISPNKGISPSEETKQKISASLTGNKLSPESILKRTETRRKNGWNKRSNQL